MATQSKAHLTEAEYLALDRTAAVRSELLDGEMFAMAGASLSHVRITGNVYASLRAQLERRGCEVFTSDLRVRVPRTGLFTYPDLVIVCGEPELYDDEAMDTLLNPALIVEVLSDTTEAYDRGEKFAHYRTIESLEGYVLVAQDRVLVEHYARQGDLWVLRAADRPDQTVELASVGCELALADVYQRVQHASE